jgi:CheY-like chemotaxis protein
MANDSPCVLVVDDDEDVLYALRLLLEGRGCRVFATSSPRAAVDYMKEFEPAVARSTRSRTA